MRLLYPEVEVTKLLSSIIKSPFITIAKEKNRLISFASNTEEYSVDLEESVIKQLKNSASLELAAAREDGNKLISEAKIKAENIIHQASIEAEEIKNKALETGRTQGYEKGLADGEQQGNAIKKQAEDVLRQAQSQREQTIKDIEPKMVDLITSILYNLSGHVVEKETLILNLIRKGFMEIEVLRNIVIHVPKEDFDYVNENKQWIYEELGENTEFEILKDHNLSRGDCLIETEVGTIDSSISTQLALLIQDLKLILNHQS